MRCHNPNLLSEAVLFILHQEAIKSVNAIIDAVVGDNEYGDSTPKEREAVVGTLKAGRALLATAAAAKIFGLF